MKFLLVCGGSPNSKEHFNCLAKTWQNVVALRNHFESKRNLYVYRKATKSFMKDLMIVFSHEKIFIFIRELQFGYGQWNENLDNQWKFALFQKFHFLWKFGRKFLQNIKAILFYGLRVCSLGCVWIFQKNEYSSSQNRMISY